MVNETLRIMFIISYFKYIQRKIGHALGDLAIFISLSGLYARIVNI